MTDCMYEYRFEHDKLIEVDKCYICKDSIYEGEIYYDINNKSYCENCIDEARKED